MNLKPLGDRIVVKVLSREEKTKGGIVQIGLIRMILPGTEKAGVGVAVNEKNFVLSNNRVDK